MPAKPCVAMAVGLTILSNPVLASPYDDCILQHMGTAQNKEAVYAIERACINKTSVSIPPDDTSAGSDNAVVGEFNMGGSSKPPEYGLVVTMKNITNYDITELIVTIEAKDTYVISRYPVAVFNEPLSSNVLIAGLAEPAHTQIIKPGESRHFFVHINEASAKPSDFWNKIYVGYDAVQGYSCELADGVGPHCLTPVRRGSARVVAKFKDSENGCDTFHWRQWCCVALRRERRLQRVWAGHCRTDVAFGWERRVQRVWAEHCRADVAFGWERRVQWVWAGHCRAHVALGRERRLQRSLIFSVVNVSQVRRRFRGWWHDDSERESDSVLTLPFLR